MSVVIAFGCDLSHICLTESTKQKNDVIAATFPFVSSADTVLSNGIAQVPEGLHAIAFREESHTAHVTRTNMFLLRKSGDDFFATLDMQLSPVEREYFNPFIRSDADIMVVDNVRNIVYTTNLMSTVSATMPHRLVTMEAILHYICKKMSFEELAYCVMPTSATSTNPYKLDKENKELRLQLREMEEEILRMKKAYDAIFVGYEEISKQIKNCRMRAVYAELRLHETQP